MANTSVSLVDLDFETIKSNLKTYLKRSDSPFKDVDFEGSNISQLLDVLSYNTYLNTYYLNMVASEMFLDTAQLRDSVISHAKELNYLPSSYRSAAARVSFNVTPSTAITSLVIPKGTSFTAKVGSNNYSFTTDTSTVVNINANNQFAANLAIYEGSYVADSFVYDAANTSQRFVLSNPTIDTTSLTVTVIEDNGASALIYTKQSSLLGAGANSQIYFLQGAENSQYEIVFGDGVIGRKPKNGSVVSAEYRVCNGELPNGARTFDIDGPISGQSNISSVSTVSIAAGGSVGESIESIKYNAPRHYQNQERAVTASDYETLLINNFPEIQAVAAYGGEDASPPQYGKVFVAVDDFNIDGASESSKQKYYNYLKDRSPLSIDPVIIDPEFIYVEAQVLARYNVNATTLQTNDIATLVKTVISSYSDTNLSGFKKTLRQSQLIQQLNEAHTSIISCDLYTIPYKKLLITPGTTFSRIVEFGFPLSINYTISYDDYITSEVKAVYSFNFNYSGRLCNLQDDRNGNLGIYTATGVDKNTLLINVGTVNYETGEVIITNLTIDSLTEGDHLHLYANPLEKDITSTKNYILTIPDDDIMVDVQAIKL
jgi:hypothetical protein